MLFVKGDVTPSTKVRDDPHKAWILFEIPKKSECEDTDHMVHLCGRQYFVL